MKKLALIVAAIVGATTAHATIVISLSHGIFAFGGPNYATGETISFTTVPGLGAGDTLNFGSQATAGGLGYATFSNGTDNLVFDTVINSYSVLGGTISIDGVWTYDSVNSTGAFAGYTGSGTFSQSLHLLANNFAASEFVGNLEAVPEPASMLALGIGAAAFIRRRVRK